MPNLKQFTFVRLKHELVEPIGGKDVILQEGKGGRVVNHHSKNKVTVRFMIPGTGMVDLCMNRNEIRKAMVRR